MFNKMSSLCCAVAAPGPSLLCHCCANLGISSLFHANASEAKPCRSETLRCTTFPSQITSALFSAIPSRRHAPLCLHLACLCFSVPLHSSSPHSLRFADLSNAVAHRSTAVRCLCGSVPCSSSPSPGQSTHINAFAARNHSQPCHGHARLYQAIQCPRSQAFTS